MRPAAAALPVAFLPVRVMASISAAFAALPNARLTLAASRPFDHASLAVRRRDETQAQLRQADGALDAATATRFHEEILPHLDAAHNLARYLSRDGDAAQDIVQEAFLRAFRGFGSFRGGNSRAWIFAIVRNCSHSWRARQRATRDRVRPNGDLAAAHDGVGDPWSDPWAHIDADASVRNAETPETDLIRRTEAEQVRVVISGLPDIYREVLVLREFEDLSYREIAEITDSPIGTVMARLSRARRLFGEQWKGQRGDGEEAP